MKLQWSKFKYYSSNCHEQNTESPEYPGLLVEIAHFDCCTLDRDVRLRGNDDGEDGGTKERRVKKGISNVLRTIQRTAAFPRGRVAAFYS